MTHPDITHLIDRVITRRKERLRLLYALFLAYETTPDVPVPRAALADRLEMTAQAIDDASAYLSAAGYAEVDGGPEPALRILHPGRVAIENALVRFDRETLEFPPLRSVLNSDLQLGPERKPGESAPSP